MNKMRIPAIILHLLICIQLAGQGALDPKDSSGGIHRDSSIIISWANTVRVMPGMLDISDPGSGRVDIAKMFIFVLLHIWQMRSLG